ncbi:tRNA A64-2'-O-ribosylphosphate transferase [Coemansia sp. RSA 988]|nr:tRNA A64-2'-O-ribosylphosphate transferase [Coemansia sp. RSA 988]
MPDSLARTIPIWCSVWNMAIQTIAQSLNGWDCSVHTPNVVSESERLQIEGLIPGFAESLLSSDIDVKWAAERLLLPLRPIWITRDQLLTMPPDFTNVEFTPIICLSASIAGVNAAHSMPFGYVQGAADDHELWAEGLTPRLFWKHRVMLLADRDCCDKRVKELIAKDIAKNDSDHMDDLGFAFVRDTGLAIGGRSSGHPPECWTQFDAIVNCGAPEYEANTDPSLAARYLYLSIPEGKRGQIALGKSIPQALDFLRAYVQRGANVLVHCSQGMDRSVGIALAALVKYFDANGKSLAETLKEDRSVTTFERALGVLQGEWRRIEIERREWEVERIRLKSTISASEKRISQLSTICSSSQKHIAVLETLLREARGKGSRIEQNPNDKEPISNVMEVVETTTDTRERTRVLLERCADEIDALLGNNDGLERAGLRRSISSLNATQQSQRQPPHQSLPSPRLNGVIESDTAHLAATVATATASRESLNMASAQVRAATQPPEQSLVGNGSATDSQSVAATINGNSNTTASAPSSQTVSRPIRKISERRRRSSQTSPFSEGQLTVDEIDASRTANTSNLRGGWTLSRTFAGHMDSVRAVCMRGTLALSGGDDGMAMVWDLTQQRSTRQTRGPASDTAPAHVLRGHLAAVTSVALGPGYAFAGGLDSSIRVWQLPTTPSDVTQTFPLRELRGHTEAVWGLTLAEYPSLLASVSADATCRLWSVDARHVSAPLRSTLTHPGSATPTAACFVAADGSRLAAGDDAGQVLVHDITAGAVATVLRRRADDALRSARITAIAGPPQQHGGGNVVATAASDGVVQLYDVRSARALTTSGIRACPSPAVAATAVAFLPSTQSVLVTGGSDGMVKWWDWRNPLTCMHEVSAHRRKADEGVCALATGVPAVVTSTTMVASAGADAMVRIYESC